MSEKNDATRIARHLCAKNGWCGVAEGMVRFPGFFHADFEWPIVRISPFLLVDMSFPGINDEVVKHWASVLFDETGAPL